MTLEEIGEKIEKNVVARENNGVNKMAADVETLTERRHYELDKNKSMKKKLVATSEEPFKMIETAGGVKIIMNAGTYELFRYAADKHFGNCDEESFCKKTEVHDKAGNCVESKYKVSARKAGHYMLNMYHTTTSCLVNGRNTSKFLDIDLQKIVSIIDQKVSQENCSITDFNDSVREMILMYLISRNQSRSENETADVPAILNLDSERAVHVRNVLNVSCQTEDSAIPVSKQSDQVSQSTQTTTDLFELVSSIHSEIVGLKQTLNNHILSTENKFGRICDELVQVKKQFSVCHSVTDQAINEIDNKQSDLKSSIQKAHEFVKNRLQGIFDTLKNLHEKTPMSKTQNTSETTQHQTNRPNDQVPTSSQNLDMNVQNSETNTYYSNVLSSNANMNNSSSPVESANEIPQKTKTLIVGNSIIKGIQPRGLSRNVDQYTCPGAIITGIGNKIHQLDMSLYSNVILYVGGNDVNCGKRLEASRVELLKLIRYIQHLQSNVHVCTVSPRVDADVRYYNNMVREVCAETGAAVIDTYSSFVYGDGNTVRQYYSRDGVHLNKFGSRTLVRAINQQFQIVKTQARANVSAPNRQYMNVRQQFDERSHGFSGWNRSNKNGQRRTQSNI